MCLTRACLGRITRGCWWNHPASKRLISGFGNDTRDIHKRLEIKSLLSARVQCFQHHGDPTSSRRCCCFPHGTNDFSSQAKLLRNESEKQTAQDCSRYHCMPSLMEIYTKQVRENHTMSRWCKLLKKVEVVPRLPGVCSSARLFIKLTRELAFLNGLKFIRENLKTIFRAAFNHVRG